MIDISYEYLVPFLILLSAFFAFKASKNYKNKTSFLIASSAFMVIFLSYAVPIIGALSVQAIPLDYDVSVEEYANAIYTTSSIIMFIGNLLLTYSMYTFSKERENV